MKGNMVTLDYTLDLATSLPNEDQLILADILHKRQIEIKRNELAEYYNSVKNEIKNGTYEIKSMEQVIEELNNNLITNLE